MKLFNFFSKQRKAKTNLSKSIYTNPIKQNTFSRLNVPRSTDNYFERIRIQARNLENDFPLIQGYLNTMVAQILGDEGLVLDIATPNTKLNKAIQNKWFKYELDIDFEDIEEQILRNLIRDGEVFIYCEIIKNKLHIKLLDSANFLAANTNYKDLFYSIKYKDESCEEIKSFIYTDPITRKTIEINSNNIIYVKNDKATFSHRGISEFVSVILNVTQCAELKEAELDRAQLQSKLTGFLKEKENPLADTLGDDEEIQLIREVDSGKMQFIPSNVDVEMIKEYNPVSLQQFLLSANQETAKALKVDYATYTGDMSQVNFSSIRQGALINIRNYKRLQKKLARKIHSVIFTKWLEIEYLNEQISLKDYELIKANFSFKGQGYESIDPTKDAQANDIQLKNGTKTYSEILREKGKELDTHLSEMQKEQELIKLIKERDLDKNTQNNTQNFTQNNTEKGEEE